MMLKGLRPWQMFSKSAKSIYRRIKTSRREGTFFFPCGRAQLARGSRTFCGIHLVHQTKIMACRCCAEDPFEALGGMDEGGRARKKFAARSAAEVTKTVNEWQQ